MEFKQILELMNAFSESEVYSLKIEKEEFKIKLDKEPVSKEVVVSEKKPVTVQPTIQPQKVQVEEQEDVSSKEEDCHIVESPMVGTFYNSPSPEAEAYVEVGTKVSKGQTLCIIEAMKLMNEIESDYDGEIVEVLVKNEQMVEYGQPLFKVK